MTPIAEQVAELKAGLPGRLPDEVLAAFAAEQDGLVRAGVPAGVARPGAAMPDGDLLDVHGEPTTLAAARAGRPAVVVLYRGAWCPFCNIALRTYQRELAGELERRGVALVAVSPQRPDGSLTVQEEHGLAFAVLSDPGNRIAGGLGVLTAPSADVRRGQATLGLDVAAANADGTAALPMPTAVVVDRDGVIAWIDVHPDYTTRTEPAAILAAVDALG